MNKILCKVTLVTRGNTSYVCIFFRCMEDNLPTEEHVRAYILEKFKLSQQNFRLLYEILKCEDLECLGSIKIIEYPIDLLR